MKKTKIDPVYLLLFIWAQGAGPLFAGGSPNPRSPFFTNEPDSVYLFSYATVKDQGRSGLHFAWSNDARNWNLVGNEFGYVKSDYGQWGSQKQMNSPYLFIDAQGNWRCIWSLNATANQFAHTTSTNLITWGRQAYPYLNKGQNFQNPVVQYDKSVQQYIITYISGNQPYKINTIDFKTFDAAVAIPAAAYKDDRITVNLPSGAVSGSIRKVAWPVIDQLTKAWQLSQYKDSYNRENAHTDSIRYANLKHLSASVMFTRETPKPISDLLIGVFFEDINYAADGGLYAELIQNRDFEYTPADKANHDTAWNSRYSWTVSSPQLSFTIDSTAPVHPNNLHYAVLHATQTGGALTNSGYDGIPLKKGDEYEFSLFAKSSDGKSNNLLVKLVSQTGAVLAQAAVKTSSTNWKKYSAKLIATADAKDARLELQPQFTGRLQLDVISLFPKKTYKNRKNGMRADLAETIAAIRPRFIRFPGGCVAHGDGLDNIYRWKNTIGAIEARKPQPNLWRYHQTAGIGYFEYFQYCEDIGAAPLPVIAAGVPCQNSRADANGGGQQGGIPMSEMDEFVQDVLDLVEWANGPITSKWGKLRAAAGHPAPFNLKYIGIGNEDLITDIFEERFAMIYKALQQKHPEITVIGTVGPFHDGTDYEQGWQLASKLNVPMVDEHYYESPGWFINNQHYYDHYDRKKPKVYLGEYASRGNTIYNALAEALYLISVERNADVVHMTSYAPLLAKEKHTQWTPDLIYFNNTEVKPTINYEVQKLFGNNSGNEYLPVDVKLNSRDEGVTKRFGVSVVRDTASGTLYVKVVNLLPDAIPFKFFPGDVPVGGKVERSVLQGAPGDKVAEVKVSEVSVGNELSDTLPAYSFTVYKIRK
jgi:alpha-L-arabinofuranosidase